MDTKIVMNVRDFEPVSNVCDQELREIFSYKDIFSVAHVKMAPGNISLRHVHEKMSEFYFITKGQGILHASDWAREVYPGTFKLINPGTDHFLGNPYEESLEHIVVAVPPFNPDDIKLLNDSSIDYDISRFKHEKELFLSYDRAMIRELLNNDDQKKLGLSMASGYLGPHKKALLHLHKNTDEIYYIFDGYGLLRIDDRVFNVSKDDFAFIPRGSKHSLENTEGYDLKVLCIASPPYKDDDFILV